MGCSSLSARSTSVSAWRYWHWGPKNDRDFTGLPVYTKVNNPTVQNQYTQEFRYAHEVDKLEFVVGAFAFYQEIRTSGVQETGPAASAKGPLLNLPSADPLLPHLVR